jgi:outer membrane lipoprotein-sorting protein
VQLENTFSDFRQVGGLVFPNLIETHVKDRPQVLRIAVEKIELNPDLDDARFRFPR